jgi:hypothetical protein
VDFTVVHSSAPSSVVSSYIRFRFRGTGQTNISSVRYSIDNNGLPSNNRFLGQGNTVSVNVFAEMFFQETSVVVFYTCTLRLGNAGQIC